MTDLPASKNSIFIFSLEPIETRYTGQWVTSFPDILSESLNENYNIISILGDKISSEPTAGAFLNFSDTNIWKNTQINKFINKINNGEVKGGDIVIFPDAWHTGIIQLRYLFDLLDYDVKIYSLWHAGSYDPNDFLGRKVKNKKWSYAVEKSFFEACDKNFFATEFHKEMFLELFPRVPYEYPRAEDEKIKVVGFPFDYLEETLSPYKNIEKENIILFPHRVSPEKQLDIFLDLKESLPEYEFIVCQEKNLSKEEYHTLLGRSKMVFSANLQETLGISCYEGLLCNSFPLVPNRLSYKEMYPFSYPSEWTESFEKYLIHKNELIETIHAIMKTDFVKLGVVGMTKIRVDNFFKSNKLIKEINGK